MDSEKCIAPWWVEDTEIFLETRHGDLESLLAKHEGLHYLKPYHIAKPHKGRSCPKCKTVFQYTRHGTDLCPFCRNKLNFAI